MAILDDYGNSPAFWEMHKEFPGLTMGEVRDAVRHWRERKVRQETPSVLERLDALGKKCEWFEKNLDALREELAQAGVWRERVYPMSPTFEELSQLIEITWRQYQIPRDWWARRNWDESGWIGTNGNPIGDK